MAICAAQHMQLYASILGCQLHVGTRWSSEWVVLAFPWSNCTSSTCRRPHANPAPLSPCTHQASKLLPVYPANASALVCVRLCNHSMHIHSYRQTAQAYPSIPHLDYCICGTHFSSCLVSSQVALSKRNIGLQPVTLLCNVGPSYRCFQPLWLEQVVLQGSSAGGRAMLKPSSAPCGA